MVKRVFKKGDIICQEQTPGNDMFQIISGRVRAYITINTEKIELSVFKKNDFFGEMSFLLDDLRTASVEALEETEVLILDSESIVKKIQTDPNFAVTCLTVMARRLKEAHSVISRIEGEKKSLKIIHGVD